MKPDTSAKTPKDAAPEHTEHILYELWMFCVTVEFFALPEEGRRAWIANAPQRLVNAIMESMLLHTRVLGDFFGRPKEPPEKDDQKPSLYTDKEIPATCLLAADVKRIHKEIAHLSEKRRGDDHPNKKWDVRALFEAVSVAIDPFLPELERSADVTPDLQKDFQTMTAAFRRTQALLGPRVDLSRQAGVTVASGLPEAKTITVPKPVWGMSACEDEKTPGEQD